MAFPSPLLATGGGQANTAVTGGTIVVPTSTLPVVSTVGFPTSGQLVVQTLVGGLYTPQNVNYTGITGGSFTGCTGWSAAGTTGSFAPVTLSGSFFSWVVRGYTQVIEYVGPNFAIMTVSGATGTPQVGDVLQEAAATPVATATVAQVLQTGSTTIVFVNGVVGQFTGTNPITTLSGSGSLSGTSGGTASLAGGGASQSTALTFSGAPLAVIGKYIVRYDGTYWTIVFTMSPVDPSSTRTSGLYVFYVRGRPLLGLVWGDPTISQTWRVTSRDGLTWSKALINGSAGLGATGTGVQRQTVYNNVLYFASPGNTIADDPVHQAWDPATDSISKINGSTATGQPRPGGGGAANAGPGYVQDYCPFQNMLIMLAQDGDQTASLYKLNGSGVTANWTRVLSFADTGGVTTASSQSGAWSLYTPGDGNLYALYYATNGTTAGGWVLQRVTFSGGVWAHSQVQSTVFPTTQSPSPPTEFNGYIYPGGNLIFGNNTWRVNVDDVTGAGSPRTIFTSDIAPQTFGPGFLSAGGLQTFQWQGSGSQVLDVNAIGLIAALPTTRGGGGERFWWNAGIFSDPRPDVLITSISSAPSKILFDVTMPNLSTAVAGLGSPEALPQPTISVASTSGFPTSGTILVTSDVGVQSIAYTGKTTNSFTGCTGGTGNIDNGALVQATQTLEFLFSGVYQPPAGAMTLVSTTRGVISSNTVLAVPADGGTTSVGWSFTTDGVTNFSPVEVQPSIANGYPNSDGVGGPAVQMIVDPILSTRAGSLRVFAPDAQAQVRAGRAAVFTTDFQAQARSGRAAVFTTDFQAQQRTGSLRTLVPDLQAPARAGALKNLVPDLQAPRRAGPIDNATSQFPVSGEVVIGGDVFGTEDIGGVVTGEF